MYAHRNYKVRSTPILIRHRVTSMRGYLSVVQSVLLVSLYVDIIIYITFSIVCGESQHDSALVKTVSRLVLYFQAYCKANLRCFLNINII